MPEDSAARPSAPALQARAMDNLDFIRSTMERASAFTAVPGWGNVAIGCTALLATFVAARQATAQLWLLIWLIEAAIALALALWTMRRKARIHQIPLFTGPSAKFWRGLYPPLAAGLLLTIGLLNAGQYALLPGLWLLLYGTAIVTGGAHSIRIVSYMGLFFIALGTFTLIFHSLNDYALAAGFGLGHIGFGFVIARKYGG